MNYSNTLKWTECVFPHNSSDLLTLQLCDYNFELDLAAKFTEDKQVKCKQKDQRDKKD